MEVTEFFFIFIIIFKIMISINAYKEYNHKGVKGNCYIVEVLIISTRFH